MEPPNQSLKVDPNGATGTVTIPNGPFSGLVASVTPYLLDTTATQTATGAQVRLQRKINNYLVPIFQFGMFSNEDLEVHPGPPFAFNGRVHANGNLYISGDDDLSFQSDDRQRAGGRRVAQWQHPRPVNASEGGRDNCSR